jgi:hypothetical protein
MPISTDKLQTRRMLRGAADFAAKAMAYVVSELEEGMGPPSCVFHDYARLVHSLEVHFLFPNLSEEHREALTRISQVKTLIQAYSKEEIPGCNPDRVEELAARIQKLGSELAILRTTVSQPAFMAPMTPTQRRLLELEFLGPMVPHHPLKEQSIGS